MNAPAPTAQQVGWDSVDVEAVNTVRTLAADAVEKVGNGHPGTAISLAPLAYLLYQNTMQVDPADPHWLGRDRFVLSAGHSSLTQYIQLYLGGFGLELEDLQSLRTWGSKTPGHPEYRHTEGVEITTGPLGQGLASAVGMAMAARRERTLFDPDAPDGTSPFDHTVWVIASDGDLQEGVTSEASSLAGTQELGNLVVVWDNNEISIEGHTSIAFTEDVLARYEAYGWHTQRVDWTNGGTEYREDVDALAAALAAAKAETSRPSIIDLRTIIAWPAPTKQNTGGAHGSKLGTDEVRGLKEALGVDPDASFAVSPAVLERTRSLADRVRTVRAEWQAGFDSWRAAQPDRAALLDRLLAHELPDGWTDALPTWGTEKDVATRSASGEVLTALADVLPELWGGSADLAGSNNTTMKGAQSFIPAEHATKEFPGDIDGRTLHFGIREHAMGAILSGIALHGPTRPYGGTFLTFSDYMRGAVRLASLMGVPATYVWTHDSIGLGEDGPTHQPIEHLAALRAIPGLTIVRPADANETAVAWREILSRREPTGLVLTRQNVPVFPRGRDGFAAADGVARGAYVLVEASRPTPDVVLVATGSEVQLAVAARETLEADGVATRVVSAPSLEWFAQQDADYREQVLPAAVRARVSVEAGVALSWHAIVGDAGRSVSIEHYGASADHVTLFREFGFTPEAVVSAARESLAAANGDPAPAGRVAAGASATGDQVV
ncbi:transketolase [Beutenbergia cavernae DSM 12333]|uniref:Transketolase n=1 Tax=Beutenbergia cavernae (strain ATCC BAA-8 / DSM 12333 / CCUG 43141 / JCM 11478 / NBRC 16432 / NCIMB 13614 / HKI 0122) TaxID=471853 RepID=C5BV26_BEUC1|nr:transketolase [Beutenbergia cavernae]ACQ80413.1 transketolase [Beutenbergia cavernae DSM 12333]